MNIDFIERRTSMTKQYKKGCGYSYTCGFFPTINLIENKKDLVRQIYVSEEAVSTEGYRKLITLVDRNLIVISSKAVEKLGGKGNDHVIAVFDEYEQELVDENDHVVLVNPMDMGNLGNIMRTMLAFGYKDLAIIHPSADRFNPKTVRSSMGAMFSIRIEEFDSFDDYLSKYRRPYYPFILQTDRTLGGLDSVPFQRLALVFGNESSGLPSSIWNDNGVRIEESDEVDSLNLTTAVAVALYNFRYKIGRR